MADSNQKDLLDAIAQANRANESFALISVVNANSVGAKFILRGAGELYPRAIEAEWLDAAVSLARDLLNSGNSATLSDLTTTSGEQLKIAIEAIRPKARVVIFGGGHVGHALATMSMLAGYGVLVIDDREAFASRERLPDTRIDLLVAPFPEAARNVQITTNTAIVIVTRGHQHDEICLRAVANSNARYIGMIGSRRRVISVFKKLAESGIPQGKLDRVHAPIGLRIGARSPQEIAVAILGEIIQTFNSPPPA
jgi:xanthine dehydrogenase accessory factor